MIDEFIKLVQMNSAYPVGQCIYGYSDQFGDPPFAFLLNWKTVPTYTTGGIDFFTHTFDLYLTHQNFTELDRMDKALANALQGEQVTPETMACIYEGSDVIQDELYIYRKAQHWTIQESNPSEHN